jgi:hypothetical protein
LCVKSLNVIYELPPTNMGETIPNGGGDKPEGPDDKPKSAMEEAVEAGLPEWSKKTGKPISQIINEQEKRAEDQEDTTLMKIYKRVKKRLFGN